MSENFVSLNEKVRTPEDSVKYLQDKGIVKTETVCSKCERVVSKMSKKKNFYFFRCLWCQTVESIRSGTFLYGKVCSFPVLDNTFIYSLLPGHLHEVFRSAGLHVHLHASDFHSSSHPRGEALKLYCTVLFNQRDKLDSSN